MTRGWYAFATLAALAACGDNGPGLASFYPDLPPEGGSTGASAGVVEDASQLLTGPAQSGLVGDFFIKNDKVAFIVQAPTRVIGVIPQGGNVVDAALLGPDGKQITDDHFGELGLIYLLGRTCEPDHVEIVRDGSKGGPAVLRSIGKSGNDDFLNIKGIGVLPVDKTVDPDNADKIQCATTYVLEPGATTLAVYHSLFNAGSDTISGPMGTIADTGGNTEAWTDSLGFERVDISALATLSTPHPIDYVVYQAPNVAYGIVPRHADSTVEHAEALIAGVSILLDGNTSLLDILNSDKYFLHLPPNHGVLQQYDLVVGHDANAADIAWRNNTNLTTISGKVTLADNSAALGARVGVFLDANNDGMIADPALDADNDGRPDERAVTYFDVAADGTYSGQIPTDAGNLLVRAEVKNVGRSPATPAAASVNLVIPSPIKVDFQITDAETGMPIPGRLIVVGDHPAFPDQRLFEVADRVSGIVTQQHCIRGTTTDLGDGADPAIYLPAGGTYRIYASRGTEWSTASVAVTASGTYSFALAHVNPTPGYLGTDWHVHQVGSPDSPVLSDERVRSALSAGVEMFATTDHDYVSDLQPYVAQFHAERELRVLPGIEVTPFAYGHYQTWPLEPDATSANHGAIDWGRGAMDGDAMIPSEIYAAMRARGGKMVQVNHPRNGGFTAFQSAFVRANVKYDYANRTIFGDYMNAAVANAALRLPETSLWSDQFNGLEIWNGFSMKDTDGDGILENQSLDLVLHDWFAMLSLGMYVTPFGNSDTHTTSADPLGMPRTYIRVPDDSGDALASGSAIDAVLATQTGSNNTPRDVVVTDGPMIDVQFHSAPALGSVIAPAAANGPVTLTVKITAPDWAEFDTLEVFANATPDPAADTDVTALVPLKCYTSRPLADVAASPSDPCTKAMIAPEAMTVSLAPFGTTTAKRYTATVTVTLDASDIVTRQGATGKDAWLVFRARGNRAIFPIMLQGVVTDATKSALLGGDFATIRSATTGLGTYAYAITAPVFVDFDGGGYRAPFAPGP